MVAALDIKPLSAGCEFSSEEISRRASPGKIPLRRGNLLTLGRSEACGSEKLFGLAVKLQ